MLYQNIKYIMCSMSKITEQIELNKPNQKKINQSYPKLIPNGPRMDPKRIKNGSKIVFYSFFISQNLPSGPHWLFETHFEPIPHFFL
jgi:hypothetical protein